MGHQPRSGPWYNILYEYKAQRIYQRSSVMFMVNKILIIEDDHEIQNLYRTAFEIEKFEVISALDGEEGLKKVHEERPSLILLDIMMPDKDGLVLLKEIKDIDKEVSVAMITAYKDAERVIEAFRLGAMDCLLKPFNVDYIANTVLPRVRVRSK